MVVDLRLKGRFGKKGLMFIPYYGRSNSWELYCHGLGDRGRNHRNSAGKCVKTY